MGVDATEPMACLLVSDNGLLPQEKAEGTATIMRVRRWKHNLAVQCVQTVPDAVKRQQSGQAFIFGHIAPRVRR